MRKYVSPIMPVRNRDQQDLDYVYSDYSTDDESIDIIPKKQKESRVSKSKNRKHSVAKRLLRLRQLPASRGRDHTSKPNESPPADVRKESTPKGILRRMSIFGNSDNTDQKGKPNSRRESTAGHLLRRISLFRLTKSPATAESKPTLREESIARRSIRIKKQLMGSRNSAAESKPYVKKHDLVKRFRDRLSAWSKTAKKNCTVKISPEEVLPTPLCDQKLNDEVTHINHTVFQADDNDTGEHICAVSPLKAAVRDKESRSRSHVSTPLQKTFLSSPLASFSDLDFNEECNDDMSRVKSGNVKYFKRTVTPVVVGHESARGGDGKYDVEDEDSSLYDAVGYFPTREVLDEAAFLVAVERFRH